MTMTTTNLAPVPAEPKELLAGLRWRYATKKFDPSKKIPSARWEVLEEALVLAPSSFGLQPWKFFVVDDPALRSRLKTVSWNQGQITDADKLVVFAARKDFGAADVERYVASIAAARQVPLESLAQYKQMMLGSLTSRAPEALQGWVARQVYIALGVFLTAAASLGVDACPIEGIDPAGYDDILRLPGQGYTALFVAAAGFRSQDDAYARLAKVRFGRKEVVAHV